MKKMMSFSMIAATMIILLFGFSGIVFSGDKVIEFSYNSFFPSEYGMGKAAEKWAREVEKRSNGKLKITMYHGGALSPADQVYESVVMGASDIGQSCLAYTRGRFPLMEAIDLPGYSFNAQVTTKIADELYRKFKPKELSDVKVLYLHAHIPGVIYTKNKPVHKLEDLKGLRIRSTGLSTKILEALGATPVAMAKGDQYDALLKGVVDGTVGSPNELKGWRVAEVANYSTNYPPAGYVTGMFVVMNLDKWNSLPEELQKILDQVSKEWVHYTGEAWNKIEKEGIEYGREKGHQFINISDEEGKRWEQALEPLFSSYVEEMKKRDLPGEQLLMYREELIEKYSKEYPPIEF